jgi:hypothetical protein
MSKMRLDKLETKDVQDSYRNCFAAATNREVLQHLLYELGLFQRIPEDDEAAMRHAVALHNQAIQLLYWLDQDESELYDNFVRILNLPPAGHKPAKKEETHE